MLGCFSKNSLREDYIEGDDKDASKFETAKIYSWGDLRHILFSSEWMLLDVSV